MALLSALTYALPPAAANMCAMRSRVDPRLCAATGAESTHGLMMATESLVKIAECKLASNQFAACTHVCSSLLTRRHCVSHLRTRVLLVRALSLAGQHLYDEALADVHHCSLLSSADKQHALQCLVQRIMHCKHMHEDEGSTCSSPSHWTVDDEVCSPAQDVV